MEGVSHIRDLIRQAMQKQAASMDTKRNDEHEQDVTSGFPATVDSQSQSEATGRIEKDPAVNIGTKAEASTDTEQNGCAKDKNDDQAFKSASELRKLAARLAQQITKAAETALTVDAPEAGNTVANTPDSNGGTEPLKGTETSDGSASQTNTGDVQSSPVTKEQASRNTAPEKDPAEKSASVGELAEHIYKLAKVLLYSDEKEQRKLCKQANVDPELLDDPEAMAVSEEDVDALSEEEADELAAALEASAMDAAGSGVEDADNVADYLEAYEAAPEVLGDEGEIPADAVPVDAGAAPGGEEAEIAGLIQMLEEAGVSPEELMGATKAASVKKADAGWTKLSKAQKHDVIMSVVKGLGEDK